MIKCTILIPTTYNDGRKIPQREIDRHLQSVRKLHGGYTLENEVTGVYTMADALVTHDSCLKLWVVCDYDKLSQTFDVAAEIARHLEQETVYLEWHETNVEFVKPGV